MRPVKYGSNAIQTDHDPTPRAFGDGCAERPEERFDVSPCEMSRRLAGKDPIKRVALLAVHENR
jgi:hypothetical protein